MAQKDKYSFRSKNAVPISDGLKKLYKEYKIEGKINQMQIADEWKKMMGDAINNKTESIFLHKDTLTIKFNSPILKQELMYAKEKIKNHMNKTIGSEIIKIVNII